MQDEQYTDEDESTVLEEAKAHNEGDKDETPEESTRLALKELQKGIKAKGDQIEENTDTSGAAEQTTEAPKSEEQTQEVVDPLDFEPPARLTTKEKNIFNKLPKSFKPAVARMFKEHQAALTRSQTEYSRALNETRHILEAVRPYYTQTPELAEAGITESGLVAALIGAHQKLTNRETVKPTITKIAADMGLKVKFVDDDGNDIKDSSTPNFSNINQHPDFIALQNKLTQLTNAYESERANALAEPIVREFEAIRSQKDSSGRYLYPEMHQETFWEQARPLINQLVAQGLSHGEASKRAHFAITGRLVDSRPSSNNSAQNRAISAGVSVRGRTTPTVTQQLQTTEIGENETPEQSARIVLEELRRGMIT